MPDRKCIVSGEVRKMSELIRFSVSPDRVVVADLAGDLPGRGLWVSARREVLAEAVARDRFSGVAKDRLIVKPDLVDEVAKGLARRSLDLLGLARRAGQLVSGFEKVRAAIVSGDAVLVIGAVDGALDGRQKISRLAGALPVVDLFRCNELSLALGRENVVHAALKAGGLANRFAFEVGRLAGLGAGDENWCVMNK